MDILICILLIAIAIGVLTGKGLNLNLTVSHRYPDAPTLVEDKPDQKEDDIRHTLQALNEFMLDEEVNHNDR